MLIQIFGSLLILIAFISSLSGFLSTDSKLYLIINVIGSTILAVNAFLTQQWGFVMLESVWAIMSLYSLLKQLRIIKK